MAGAGTGKLTTAYNGIPLMNILTGGNVGIGSTSPNTTLDVLGGAALIQGYRNEALFSYANSASTAGIGIQNTGTAATSTEMDLNLLANRTTGGQTLYSQVSSTVQNIGNASYASDLALRTSASGTLATRLYIDQSGNVGIYTTVPLFENGSMYKTRSEYSINDRL